MDVVDVMVKAGEKAISKGFKGPTSFYAKYYTKHFAVLKAMLAAVNKDKEFQKALDDIEQGLKDYATQSKEFLASIPPDPEPPDVAKNPRFIDQAPAFFAALKTLDDSLQQYVDKTGDLVDKTTDQLKKIETEVRKNDRLGEGMRQLDLLEIREKYLMTVKRQLTDAKKLLDAYNSAVAEMSND